MATDAELSTTAYVILGLLDARPRTGYEIKRVVDDSTRFFWAASYGQIYPQLRRLREAGMVEAERDDTGGRKRSRHRITAAGRRELRHWLAQPAETFELRDERLLKLFFAGSAGSEAKSRVAAAEIMAAKAERHAELAAELRRLEPRVLSTGDPFQLAVLRYGIGLNEWGAEHCGRAGEELAGAAEESG